MKSRPGTAGGKGMRTFEDIKQLYPHIERHSSGFIFDSRSDAVRNALDELGQNFTYVSQNVVWANRFGLELTDEDKRRLTKLINKVCRAPTSFDVPYMEVFMTQECGLGLRSLEQLKEGQIIGAYTGEIIPAELTVNWSPHEVAYLFGISTVGNVYIDAAHMGNELRMANHSCEPNLGISEVSPSKGRPLIAYHATTTIEPMTELTINYGPYYNSFLYCICGCKSCKSAHVKDVMDRRPTELPAGVAVRYLEAIGTVAKRVQDELQEPPTPIVDMDGIFVMLQYIIKSTEASQKATNKSSSVPLDDNTLPGRTSSSSLVEPLESHAIENPMPGGLKNIGLVCYANAVVQCFFYVTSFREFYMDDRYLTHLNGSVASSSLSKQVARCFRMLSQRKKTDVHAILDAMKHFGEYRTLGEAQDAHEFALRFILQLRTELRDELPAGGDFISSTFDKFKVFHGVCDNCQTAVQLEPQLDNRILSFPSQEVDEPHDRVQFSALVEREDVVPVTPCRNCNHRITTFQGLNYNAPPVLFLCILRHALNERLIDLPLTRELVTMNGENHTYKLKSVVYFQPGEIGHYLCCAKRTDGPSWVLLNDAFSESVEFPPPDTKLGLEQPMLCNLLMYEKSAQILEERVYATPKLLIHQPDFNINLSRFRKKGLHPNQYHAGGLPRQLKVTVCRCDSWLPKNKKPVVLSSQYPDVTILRDIMDEIHMLLKTAKNPPSFLSRRLMGCFYDDRSNKWFRNAKVGKAGERGDNIILLEHRKAVAAYATRCFPESRQIVMEAIRNYSKEKKNEYVRKQARAEQKHICQICEMKLQSHDLMKRHIRLHHPQQYESSSSSSD